MAHPLLNELISATDSFSTTVRLFLYVDDVAYELADIGPFDMTLRKPKVLSQGSDHAILEIGVDGRLERQQVSVSPSNMENLVRYTVRD
jgi:hypothetical protein